MTQSLDNSEKIISKVVYRDERCEKIMSRVYRDGLCLQKTTWIYYFENGNFCSKMSYVAGNQDGESKSWYENGQLKSEAFYKDGKLERDSKLWHENGQLFTHNFYQNGKRNGYAKLWWQNGHIQFRASYRDEISNGEYKMWNQYGNINLTEYHGIKWIKNFTLKHKYAFLNIKRRLYSRQSSPADLYLISDLRSIFLSL
jgi:antitoxin component YwqK of YwqJK toxin-antitoxin module